MAGEVKKYATLISFDYRGHGNSKVEKNKEDLSVDTLLKDTDVVLEHVAKKFPEPTIVIVGHR